ncbi:FAD-dependent monooxygenase [Rhizobium leguminosarum]|uniref:FAD-dependent monooxygenase n=1 Tax=Rhizobium leguminosarum TaxID=384 RepID=UPI0039657564
MGDAAHASSPSMAQGAGMALEDALILAGTIASSNDITSALEAFHRQRLDRVSWVQKQCHARDKLRNSPNIIRNAVIRHFGTRLYHRAYIPLAKDIDI